MLSHPLQTTIKRHLSLELTIDRRLTMATPKRKQKCVIYLWWISFPWLDSCCTLRISMTLVRGITCPPTDKVTSPISGVREIRISVVEVLTSQHPDRATASLTTLTTIGSTRGIKLNELTTLSRKQTIQTSDKKRGKFRQQTLVNSLQVRA
jgi:hypothetical protein